MTNSTGQARGWRDRRRTAVVITCMGALGVLYLGSASTASAAFTACKGSVAPKSKSNPGKDARLAFSCNQDIRAYGVVSTKAISGYAGSPTIAGGTRSYFECEGGVPASGFGCGIKDRNIPSSCGASTEVLPPVMNGPPAVRAITGPPCAQVIQPDLVVSQDITLKSDPCTFKAKEPLQMFLIAGGEPAISSFTVRGDSVDVGEYASEPFKLKVKGYNGCQAGAGKAKKQVAAKPAAIGQDLFPMGCSGKVSPKDPAKPSIDATYEFSCVQNIRGYTITSNKKLDFFGFESEVTLPNGTASGTESALIQCEGPVPGPGFGCGVTSRRAATSRLTAGNKLRAELGLPVSPCKRQPGESKLKVWLTVMGEPSLIGPPATTGEYISEPFPLVVDGYSKGACAKAAKKG